LEDHDELRWLTGQALHGVPWLTTNEPIVARLSRELLRG
jgi:hypothetical protein